MFSKVQSQPLVSVWLALACLRCNQYTLATSLTVGGGTFEPSLLASLPSELVCCYT